MTNNPSPQIIKMSRTYKNYTDYLQVVGTLRGCKDQGIKLIYKKNKIKLVVGLVCLGIAVLPNGLGLLFYPVGFALLGINLVDIRYYTKRLIRRWILI